MLITRSKLVGYNGLMFWVLFMSDAELSHSLWNPRINETSKTWLGG